MNFIDLKNLKEDEVDRLGLKSFLLLSGYYREYYGETFLEKSFVVYEKEEVKAIVLCCVLNNELTLPDGGSQCFLINTVSNKDRKAIYKKIVAYLEEMAQHQACQKIIIKDALLDGTLSLLGETLFNEKFQSRLTFEMNIESHGFSSDILFSNIRSSYKSLVNWGRKNLELVILGQENSSLNAFIEFKDFHKKIAGRQTRSDKTWDMQHDMIKKGFGEALLAYYQGELVSASLFMDIYNTSLYFTGVYERELFEYGISHYLLFEGICRSMNRGLTRSFSLGYFDTDIKDPKWYNIQFFKKGFCRNFKPVIFWSKEIQ